MRKLQLQQKLRISCSDGIATFIGGALNFWKRLKKKKKGEQPGNSRKMLQKQIRAMMKRKGNFSNRLILFLLSLFSDNLLPILLRNVSKSIEKWPATWHRDVYVTHLSFCCPDRCRSVCSLVFKSLHKYFTLKSGLNKPYICSL